MFNIIQNAVKYNTKNGVILIELNCLPLRVDEEKKSSLVEESIHKMGQYFNDDSNGDDS